MLDSFDYIKAELLFSLKASKKESTRHVEHIEMRKSYLCHELTFL